MIPVIATAAVLAGCTISLNNQTNSGGDCRASSCGVPIPTYYQPPAIRQNAVVAAPDRRVVVVQPKTKTPLPAGQYPSGTYCVEE